jgi:pyruvate formate-lyase/glycerol dehydratase family glycyl radical enzyme
MQVSMSETKKERIQGLRSTLIQTTPGICAERAQAYTAIYQQFANDPPVLKRARALKAYLEQVSLSLDENEIIPGWQSSQPRHAPIFPEYSWKWVYDELDRFDQRHYDRFTISKKGKEELRTLLPWWEGRTLYESILDRQPQSVLDAARIGAISWTGQATSGEGHIVVDHQLALDLGFKGILDRSARLKNTLPPGDAEGQQKKDFYQSVEIVFKGVLTYLQRLKLLVEQKAAAARTERKTELAQLAADLGVLQFQQPQNFRQALLVVWFVHLIQQMESNGHSVSLGRLDQYLFPYLQRDLQARVITEEEALELLEHFYLKVFSIIKLRTEAHSRTQTGYPTYQNLCVGGQNERGQDATNSLSWLCLTALADIRLPEPNFYVRVHPGTPDDFLEEALKVSRMGFGMPAFVNDEVIIPSLEKRGVTHKDALNYSTMGCVEVLIPGKWGYRANGKSKLNVLKVLELALNDGSDPATAIQLQKGGGDFSHLANFENIVDAWHAQLRFYTRSHVTADNINDQVLEEMVPNAFCSALVQDCLGRGKHLNAGGAIYDSTSGCLVGIPNVGNSLSALKKLVYEDQLFSAAELLEALESNFSSPRGEEIHQLILNRAPRYGEDDDLADQMTAMALQDYCDIITDHQNMRHGRGPIGGAYFASTNTVSANITAGEVVGATPDGRKKGEPTADGVSPSQGNGRKGPTAIFRSVAKLPTVEVTGGQLLNMRLNQSSIASDTAIYKLAALLRGFFDLKGWHVQFNTISTEVLKDAIAHPQKYPDLIVRVAGYSALFVALDPALQRDIIARMEHAIS